MKPLQKFWALLLIAARRLRSQPGLTGATAVGLVILAALVMSIPAYADAVSYRILSAQLLEASPARQSPTASRTPFVYAFHYSGPYRGATQWEHARAADAYLTGSASADLGLPLVRQARLLQTFPFQLYPPEAAEAQDYTHSLAWTSFVVLSEVERHITLVEGRFPDPGRPDPHSPVEVLLSEARALTMGAASGDRFVVYNLSQEEIIEFPVVISGLWRASDPGEAFWIIPPEELQEKFLVPEGTYFEGLVPAMRDELGEGVWYLALDSSGVHAREAAGLVNRIARVELQAGELLSGLNLQQSPQALLVEYERTTNVLSILLTAFSVPVAALFLAFINLVGGVAVERQRNEIAVLRSRGAAMGLVAGITALEGFWLAGAALLLGAPLSLVVVKFMGKTRSFLDFSLPASLRLDLTGASLAFGGLAALLMLGVRVLLVAGAARHTIITYKQERARSLRPPWWQRAWLDVLLFIPAAYGAYLLRGQGSLVRPEAVSADPFQNPLLLLVPALGIFAVTLMMLRLLPWIMTGLAWAAARTNSVGLLLASRYLSRTSGLYSSPLILLVLTLSLSAFTASLAQTLDKHYHDQQYYLRGADLALVELGQCLKYDPYGNCATDVDPETGPTWAFLPVSEHLKAPGVLAATRVGSWKARAAMSEAARIGTFMGIDRTDFPQVAFWRNDFAPDSLGALMNALGAAPEGVLVSRAYLEQEVLYVGDPLALSVEVAGKVYPIRLSIAGSFDLFPTWYPETGPLFVGNLDYFFEQLQGQQPYHVWLKTGPGVECAPLVEVLSSPPSEAGLGLDVKGCASSPANILKEQKRPEHQGLFGLLSVGFAGAALLTVLGFLLYALFSFQRRFVEMGVLRAIGLSTRQMAAFLAWELVFLISVGLGAGTLLGVLVSRLFIPYLQIGADQAASVPPFVVEIAWGRIFLIYALFGGLFVAALIGLVWRLQRMRIFQAVKLGETV